MTLPKSGGPEWIGSQAEPNLTVNESLRMLDGGANHYPVVDKDLNSPPGSCADGAVYIVGPSPTGAWAGHAGDIAQAFGANASSGWRFRDPEEGIFAWVQDENTLYKADGGTSPVSWSAFSLAGSLTLDDLTDVMIGPLVDGYVLTYDADSPAGFKLLPPGGGASQLNDLSDVETGPLVDGYVLTYDTDSPSGWKALAPAGGVGTLNDLTDVDVPSPTDGQVLTYDTDSPSGWKAMTPSGGSAKPFITFLPTNYEPPSSNYATLDLRNSHPVLDFDATTQETAIFTGVMPTGYAGGGITVSVFVAMTSATSGTVGFDVAIERIDVSSLDIDADSFATAQTITATTVPGTSGQILKLSVNISNGANMDSLAAGEAFRLRLRRDVANDTATGDAEVLLVTVEEQ